MSDIGLNYTAEPPTVNATIDVSFEDATLKAKLTDVKPFTCVIKPSGNVAEEIVSGVAWPLAQTMVVIVPQLADQILKFIPPFDIVTIEPFKQNIEGVDLTIKPQNLAVSGWNGMLKIQGQIVVS